MGKLPAAVGDDETPPQLDFGAVLLRFPSTDLGHHARLTWRTTSRACACLGGGTRMAVHGTELKFESTHNDS